MRAIRQEIFRAYDIRGRAGLDFDQDWVKLLGQACAAHFCEQGESRAVLARDCRLTSPEYARALTEAMTASGLDVLDLGMVPTPVFYFAITRLAYQAGIMVTASHNPAEDNGFKIWSGQGAMLNGQIQRLYHLMRANDFTQRHDGFLCAHNIIPGYLDYLSADLKVARPLKVVLDGGNGVGGPVCAELLSRLGLDLMTINCRPDGRFPHHPPDPTVEANLSQLSERVRAEKADLGIGLDGDADRIGVVDETGRMLAGDHLLGIYARDVLLKRPGAKVIAEVKCSSLLFDDIAAHGGQAIMARAGHSPMKASLRANGALLAGEITGHIIFADRYLGFDDAIYAAGRLVEILSQTRTPVSQLLADWPKTFATPELRLPCPDHLKFRIIEKARDHFAGVAKAITIDGLRLVFPDGWALLRASNTQPLLSLRFEAASETRLAELRAQVEKPLEEWLRA